MKINREYLEKKGPTLKVILNTLPNTRLLLK